MSEAISEQFDELVQRTIEEAERIDCSVEDFYRGLGSIIDALSQRKSLEAEELKKQDI